MNTIKPIPVDTGLDHSFQLLNEGYLFIQNRCRKLNSSIFEIRLLGKQVICMSGEKAAKVFYDDSKFQRKGAAPNRIQQSLFGKNAIQTMDGDAHHHRKNLFMDLMTPDRLEYLVVLTKQELNILADQWILKKEITLHEEMEFLLFNVACKWAGVPLEEQEVEKRARQLFAMVDAFGAVGPRHWQGRLARNQTETWIRKLVEDVRRGKVVPPLDTPLYSFSIHKEADGQLLSTDMAAIELLNILRPIVAISTYITFGALALNDFPECQNRLRDHSEYAKWFVQEVRRFYPFGPFLGARVREDFIWEGYSFTKGTLVLLDIYGTNHDPDRWENPDQFSPERFKDWQGHPFDFIPQGGGDYSKNHRCAGEWITIKVMVTVMDYLVNKIKFEVPEQDLSYSLSKMPTLPVSGFIMRDIRKV